eukprot:scaffold14095_cov116-Isochrysis_galbana.AAC.4
MVAWEAAAREGEATVAGAMTQAPPALPCAPHPAPAQPPAAECPECSPPTPPAARPSACACRLTLRRKPWRRLRAPCSRRAS